MVKPCQQRNGPRSPHLDSNILAAPFIMPKDKGRFLVYQLSRLLFLKNISMKKELLICQEKFSLWANYGKPVNKGNDEQNYALKNCCSASDLEKKNHKKEEHKQDS